MRQVRRAAFGSKQPAARSAPRRSQKPVAADGSAVTTNRGAGVAAGQEVRRQAWEWATVNRTAEGALPSGKVIADRYDRHERWGRLVKSAGQAGEFAK